MQCEVHSATADDHASATGRREPALSRASQRPYYDAADVVRLRGSVHDRAHARAPGRRAALGAAPHGALRPRARRAHRQPGRAEVQAGLKAIYLSGWQVAADANLAGQMYPDQSLYPANSVPAVVRRINNALAPRRPDRARRRARQRSHWFAPIVADAEAGFGGAAQRLRADEGDDRGGRRRRALRGPAREREEVRPHGRQGARPDAAQFIRTLIAARLAADVCDVPTRPRRAHRRRQREAAHERRRRARPRRSSTRRAHRRGLLPRSRAASSTAIARGLAYAPYADLIWCETSTPDLERGAASSPKAIHAKFPGKLLAYNCSPSFNWKKQPRRRDRSPSSSASSARWATSSSSSRSPASTRSTTSMFELARELQGPRDGGLRRAAAGGVRRREPTATPRRSTSARSAPATSMPSRRPWPGAAPRSPRLPGAPRSSSSTRSPEAPGVAGARRRARDALG